MRLIIFDVDGTLVDSQAVIVKSFHGAFHDQNLPLPDRQTCLSVVGLSLSIAIEEVVHKMGMDNAPIDDLTEGYKANFYKLMQNEKNESALYDGAKDAVIKLALMDNTLLAIATGKSRRGLDRFLQLHELNSKFIVTKSADDAISKPHPQMILDLLSETGVDANDAMMIGDTTFDIDMAVAAGVEPVGVKWGFHDENTLRQHGAVFIAQDYSDLMRYIVKN